MPKAWSKKDERQYKAINKSCSKKKKCSRLKTKAGRARCRKTCKRIAGATVNKTRKKEGRVRGTRRR